MKSPRAVIVLLILFLIPAATAQPCSTAADSDCDGQVNITELTEYIDVWYGCSSCAPDLLAVINAFYNPACIPNCTGKQCGGDGCGGSCPPGCGEREYCDDGSCKGAQASPVDVYQSKYSAPTDSVLKLSGTAGYAALADANVTDLDYSKDFSVEGIVSIEPFTAGGRWACIVSKTTNLYDNSSGLAIGTYAGNAETFGQQLHAKIGDGTNGVALSSRSYTGFLYAVMTWDSSDKNLTFYVNGAPVGSRANSNIDLSKIENSRELHIGGLTIYGTTLQRDVFMGRIWNRKLSPSEISDLFNEFNSTGRHATPGGFDRSGLVSEWLMQETSDATGGVGAGYIKDSIGSNNLELRNGSSVLVQRGQLKLEYPEDGSTDVHKAAYLYASGGEAALGGNAIHPMQYYFQVYEDPSMNPPVARDSGWLPHAGRWKPVLKPSTRYYWRARVRDSSGKVSEWSEAHSFTTEPAEDWYVRPGVYSGVSGVKPVPRAGVYGSQDGTSYANAWNGIREIVWGSAGVEAGDNLYICGVNIYNMTVFGDVTYFAYEPIKESGYSRDHPITIRMDCPGDPGTVYGMFYDSRQPVTWNGPDANGVYSTANLIYGAAAEYNGTDYVWLDAKNVSTWAGDYGSAFKNGSITYVKTRDGSSPKGKIYSPNLGYRFNLGRNSFIRFYNGRFFGSGIGIDSGPRTISEYPPSTFITYDSIELAYGSPIDLYEGNNFWTVRNSDLHHMMWGVYTHTPRHAYNLLVENNRIHDICSLCTGRYCFNPNGGDCHAVGVQNGANHIIQNNTIWDTADAIAFWSSNFAMQNMTVRDNFIRNVWAGAGHGIAVMDCSNDGPGVRAGFRIYGNVIMNTGLGIPVIDYQGDGIHAGCAKDIEICNNVVYNYRGKGILYGSHAEDGGKIHDNIVYNIDSKKYYLQVLGNASESWDFSIDDNLYYPAANFSNLYVQKAIGHDNHSVFADPLFVDAANSDFRLDALSPAIDNGTIIAGFHCATAGSHPGEACREWYGSAPDIGAHEYRG